MNNINLQKINSKYNGFFMTRVDILSELYNFYAFTAVEKHNREF